METNADKCCLLTSSDEKCAAKIEALSIENSPEVKPLRVKFNSNHSFENHICSLRKNLKR